MGIRQVSYSLIGGLLLTGACVGCVNEEYKNKAKSQAVEYLNGYDLLKAERIVEQQKHSDQISGEEIAYWDALLMEAKAKEAYIKGQQMVRDSADGKFFRKNKYHVPLDTVIDGKLVESIEKEYSQYTNAKNFIKARENAPTKNNRNNEFPYQTHYWNLITIAGKQQEAYNKGAAYERSKLSSKTE